MKFISKIATLISILTISASFQGCTAIMDDDPAPCPQGLEVRFVFDYNLERADAFPAQVECLVLHIYDSEGKWVKTLTETSGVLANEGYRMVIDNLPEGDYRLVAYGGAICNQASIRHTIYPHENSVITDLGMRLDADCLKPGSDKGHLHDHFYGSVAANVKLQPTYTTVTVKMMKNTNHFRIMLQHLNYEPLNGNDYDFEITDDNSLFDYNNDLVDNGYITYTPWSQGSVSTGVAEADLPGREATTRGTITQVQMAYADLSTSRLMTKRSPRLKVTHRPSGQVIIDIPLNNYLLALRSEHFSWCADQEFLDRKSDWPLFFFMDNDRHWNQAYIKVDDWVVRLNEIKN